MKRTIAQKPKM